MRMRSPTGLAVRSLDVWPRPAVAGQKDTALREPVQAAVASPVHPEALVYIDLMPFASPFC